MSRTAIDQVIQRAVGDAAFRRQLQRDPAGTLAGFDLTAEERAAVTGGDPARLTSLGVDQRISKAFAISGLAGSASVTADPRGVLGAALIDENAAAGTTGIIGDPTAATAAVVDPDSASPGLSAFDEGMITRSTAALDDAARTEVTDINQEANWAGGPVTAFEPVAGGTGPGLSALDPGLLGPAEVDTSFDVQVNTTVQAEESGRDHGGEIQPTEY